MRRTLIAALNLGCLIALALLIQKKAAEPLLSPLSQSTNPTPPLSQQPLNIMGFVPYWNLQLPLQTHFTTDVVYSGFSLNSNGELNRDQGWRASNGAAFARLKQQLEQQNKPLHLSFTLFDTPALEAVLGSNQSQQQAIQTIIDTTKLHQAQGVNLDFEPNTPAEATTSAKLVSFVSQLTQALQDQPSDIHLSIDIYAEQTALSIWNLSDLAEYIDTFVVMTYDYHRPSSSRAGPISPLYGSQQNRWTYDVMSSLRKILLQLPKDQVLLGIPFYGYQWQTTTDQPDSQTFPGTGALATYNRVSQLLKQPNIQMHRDPHSLSPWLSWQEGDSFYQIHYEDVESLSYKLQLTQQAGLAGIAIWALGYEGEQTDLWQPITAPAAEK